MSGQLISCALPSDEEGIYRWVTRAAVVPANMWLPKIDTKAVVAQFASEQGWTLYDAGRMFDRLCRDAGKVDTAIVLLAQRSLEYKDTLHFVGMSEFNVEAMMAADVLFQLRDVTQQLSDAINIGKHLLHGFCVFRGETVKMYDVRDARVVRSVLTQIEEGAECMICLEEFRNQNTVLPFKCGHPVCRQCFDSQEIKECFKCRTRTPWKSQRYVRLDETTKSAAHLEGSLRVTMR